MSTNPFVFDRPAIGPNVAYFRDTRTLDAIVIGLLVGNYYTLLGPRLSGATSMIWDLLRTACEREDHCRCLYVDLRALSGIKEGRPLFQSLAEGVRGLAGKQPILPKSDVTTCAEFREALVNVVSGKPMRLIVALDGLDAGNLPPEAPKLVARCARVLYNQRLSDSEFHKISVLVSGSQSPYELSTGSGSPFNIAEKYWLSDLSQQEVEQLVRAGQGPSGVSFEEAAIARIADATEGDKYFIQRICHICVQEAQQAKTQAVAKDMVSSAIAYLVSMDYRLDPCFKQLVRSLKREANLVEIVKDLMEGKEAITANYAADANRIRLTGVLKLDDGRYRFRNELYEQFLVQRTEMIRDGWRLHSQTKRMISLHDVTLGIASTLDPEAALDEATWMVLKASEADAVAIYLHDQITDVFRLEALASTEQRTVVDPVLNRDEVAREVLASQSPSVVEDWAGCSGCVLHSDACSCVWLPLIASGDMLGTALIACNSHHDFTQNVLANDILASYLASLIVRTKLIDALQMVGRIPIASNSSRDVLGEIASGACSLLNVPAALIWGLASGQHDLQVVAHSGRVREKDVRGFRLRTDIEPTKSILQRQEPLFLENIQTVSEYHGTDAAKEMGWHSLLTMPLRARGQPVGIIEVYTYKLWRVTAAQRALLKLLANQAAIAIENTSLYQRLTEDTATVASLYQISTTLRTSLNLTDVLESITSSLQKMFNLATCTVGLLDEPEQCLDFVAHRGLDRPTKRLVSDLPPDLWRRVRQEGQPAFVQDVALHTELAKVLERQDIQSFVVLPLEGKGTFLGVLTMSSTTRLHLEQRDWDLLIALTNQAAVAIENAQLYQEIRQAKRAMEDSMRILTHELRGEPAFVTNTISTLLAGKLGVLNERQRDRLEKAQRRLHEHHKLIDNLHRYGRLKGSKLVPRKTTVDVRALTIALVDEWRSAAARKDLLLECRIETLPQIEADKGMLEIILANLIDNAIKFTPEGGCISVEGWATDSSACIAVDDTGIGIPVEERERVFDEYHQVSSTPAQAEKGAGLGLYIARKLAEMHEGRIVVSDRMGDGARIEVTFPR